MKRTALALTLISALLFSAVAGTQFVNLTEANPVYYFGVNPVYNKISIQSPKEKTYNTSDVPLNFTVKTNSYLSYIPFCYDLDDGKVSLKVDRVNVTGQESIRNANPYASAEYGTLYYTELTLEGNAVLSDLSDGCHNVTVYSGSHDFVSNKVSFYIDTSAPKIVILSLDNKKYNSTDVSLNFSVGEAVSWMGYSLDEQADVTVDGNTTLKGLSSGEHNITVYATDEAGNVGASETIYFSAAVPEPFPTTLVIAASGASVAVIGIGLLVYFKKRKRG
jgi:hypothetical protein